MAMNDDDTKVGKAGFQVPPRTSGTLQQGATPIYPQPSGGSSGGRKPSQVLVWGGVLGGLAVMGVGAAVAVQIFEIAPKIISLAAYGVMGLALVRLWPAIALGLTNLGLKAEETVVRMSPLETLETEKQRVRQEVERASGRVDEAAGALEALRRRYTENKTRFSGDKQANWEERIKDRESGLVMVKDALKDMRDKYRQVETIVEEAKADLAMAEADSSMAKALGDAQADPTQSRRFDLALDQIKRITGAAESSFDTAMRAYQEKSKENL